LILARARDVISLSLWEREAASQAALNFILHENCHKMPPGTINRNALNGGNDYG